MPSATTKLGLLSTVSAIVWLVLPGTANADAQTHVTFDAIVTGNPMRLHHGSSDATTNAECAMRDADVDSLAFILDEI